MDYDKIEREIVISAPVDGVWAVLTALGHWLGDGEPAGFDLREGGRIVFRAPGGGTYPMHIEKIEPNRYIAFRWANRFPSEQPREGNSTLVEYTPIPVAAGAKTRLPVVESGFATLVVPEDERQRAAGTTPARGTACSTTFVRRPSSRTDDP